VVLVDVSESANASTLSAIDGGSPRKVSILEAERRGLRRVVDVLEEEGVEFGVVAYGEKTWPLAEPGTPAAEIRERLAAWERKQKRGVGRTDLVCALELARQWLDKTPDGMAREVLLLNDGDLPHSGRFIDCRMAARRGGRYARNVCESRRNPHPCPASRWFRERDGFSDEIQLERFARRARGSLTVYPLVFDPTRPARPYRDLAAATGGGIFRVPSAEALEDALPAVLSRRVTGVYAQNERTGERTGDLLDPKTGGFDGVLPLALGANDVLLTVEGDRGPAALYRFRIYAAPNHLNRVLADLEAENRKLEERVRQQKEGMKAPGPPPPTRRVTVAPEATAPASPARH
jgi:hypothetical protein